MTENRCGSCSMCCKLMGIKELNKPAGEWCQHVCKGKGCSIYEDRPLSCVEYKCLWLMSQDEEFKWPIEARPDKSKVVLSLNTQENGSETVVAHVDPNHPDAWEKGIVYELIKIATQVGRVVIGLGLQNEKIMLERKGDVILKSKIRMTDPDENGVQWLITD